MVSCGTEMVLSGTEMHFTDTAQTKSRSEIFCSLFSFLFSFVGACWVRKVNLPALLSMQGWWSRVRGLHGASEVDGFAFFLGLDTSLFFPFFSLFYWKSH